MEIPDNRENDRDRTRLILIEKMRVLLNLVLWLVLWNSLSLVLLFVERTDILLKSRAIKISPLPSFN